MSCTDPIPADMSADGACEDDAPGPNAKNDGSDEPSDTLDTDTLDTDTLDTEVHALRAVLKLTPEHTPDDAPPAADASN